MHETRIGALFESQLGLEGGTLGMSLDGQQDGLGLTRLLGRIPQEHVRISRCSGHGQG